jgi:hypothetical protein
VNQYAAQTRVTLCIDREIPTQTFLALAAPIATTSRQPSH